MAINKRKTLDAAQKFARKGAYAKAYKAFNDYLKVEPRDAKVRLDLGQAYLKGGKTENAIEAFLKVAEQWTKDGFDAKSVAVYKQILALDSTRTEICEPLSKLYQHMGLVNEALKTLQLGAEALQTEGKQKEALNLLRRVGSLDPSNTTARLKVAELLAREGMAEEAITEYEGIAEDLHAQGELSEAVQAYKRILELDPKRIDTLMLIAGLAKEQGDPETAQLFAMKVRDIDPNHLDAAEMCCAILSQKGDSAGVEEAYRKLAEIYRQRGDEEKAREILQRFVPVSPFVGEEEALDEDSLEETETVAPEVSVGLDVSTADKEDLDLEPEDLSIETDDDLIMETEDGSGAGDVELEEIRFDEAAKSDPESSEASVTVEVEPGGNSESLIDLGAVDLSQSLAEVKVYIRYKKLDKATSILQQLRAACPEELEVIDMLGEIHAQQGDIPEALGQWRSGLEIAKRSGDVANVQHFEKQLGEEPEQESAPELAPELEPALEYSDDDELGDFIFETNSVDAFGQQEPELEFASEPELEREPEVATANANDPESEADVDIEIDIDVDVDEFEVEIENEEEEDAVSQSDLDITLPGLDEDGLLGDVQEEGATDAAKESLSTDASSTSRANTASMNLSADLELAEFYFEQKLFEEAEVIYRKLLEVAPNHPQAQLRLGEIDQARGQEPAASIQVDVVMDETVPNAFARKSAHDAASPQVEESVELDVAQSDDVDSPDAQMAEEDSLEFVESEINLEQVDAPFVAQDGLSQEGGIEGVLEEAVAEAEAGPEPEPEPGAVTDGQSESAGLFDLRAELSGVIQGLEDGAAPSHMGEDSEESFDAIFSEFKMGVSGIVDEGDYQAHFDLGIAYRGMELLEDAIREFSTALAASSEDCDCMYMMGLCALDLGRYSDAVSHFKQVLSAPNVELDTQCATSFDLGRALQAQGSIQDAIECFRKVYEADPGFRDVADRLAAIEAEVVEGDPELSVEEDEYGETFDDLISDPALGFDISQAHDESPLEIEVVEELSQEIACEEVAVETVATASEHDAPTRKRRRRKKTLL